MKRVGIDQKQIPALELATQEAYRSLTSAVKSGNHYEVEWASAVYELAFRKYGEPMQQKIFVVHQGLPDSAEYHKVTRCLVELHLGQGIAKGYLEAITEGPSPLTENEMTALHDNALNPRKYGRIDTYMPSIIDSYGNAVGRTQDEKRIEKAFRDVRKKLDEKRKSRS